MNQDERLDQNSLRGQLRFDSLWKVRNRYDVAASSANTAFMRSIWQLFLRIRRLLGKLRSFAWLFVVMLQTYGIGRVVVSGCCIHLPSLRTLACRHAAKQHGCRSEALHRQSQHHQAKQELAKALHVGWDSIATE